MSNGGRTFQNEDYISLGEPMIRIPKAIRHLYPKNKLVDGIWLKIDMGKVLKHGKNNRNI
jgi:hypothetical protein